MKYAYFDDDLDAASELAGRISSDDFVIDVLPAPRELGEVDSAGYDGFLIDWDLSMRVHFLGGTLGSAVREQAPDVPIVLLTRPNIVEGRPEHDLLEELSQFDLVRFKHHLEVEPDRERARLIDLSHGFRRLVEASRAGTDLLSLLVPPTASDRSRLVEVGPPIGSQAWSPRAAARWLQTVVLRYPGVLLDDLHVSTLLGVAVTELERDVVASLLVDCLYRGPFVIERRWWKQAVIATGTDLSATRAGPLYLRFPLALEDGFGLIERSHCVDCGEPADEVCFVLQEPVRTAHSLAYFPDTRPAIMDAARVSLLAIRNDNRVRFELLDPNGRMLLPSLLEQNDASG